MASESILVQETDAKVAEAKVRYDRQVRLWGGATQQRLMNTTLCLVRTGLHEAAKNLVLGGVSNVLVADDGVVSEQDLCLSCLCLPTDVGVNVEPEIEQFTTGPAGIVPKPSDSAPGTKRAVAAARELKVLNHLVNVSATDVDPDASALPFDPVAVLSECKSSAKESNTNAETKTNGDESAGKPLVSATALREAPLVVLVQSDTIGQLAGRFDQLAMLKTMVEKQCAPGKRPREDDTSGDVQNSPSSGAAAPVQEFVPPRWLCSVFNFGTDALLLMLDANKWSETAARRFLICGAAVTESEKAAAATRRASGEEMLESDPLSSTSNHAVRMALDPAFISAQPKQYQRMVFAWLLYSHFAPLEWERPTSAFTDISVGWYKGEPALVQAMRQVREYTEAVDLSGVGEEKNAGVTSQRKVVRDTLIGSIIADEEQTKTQQKNAAASSASASKTSDGPPVAESSAPSAARVPMPSSRHAPLSGVPSDKLLFAGLALLEMTTDAASLSLSGHGLRDRLARPTNDTTTAGSADANNTGPSDAAPIGADAASPTAPKIFSLLTEDDVEEITCGDAKYQQGDVIRDSIVGGVMCQQVIARVAEGAPGAAPSGTLFHWAVVRSGNVTDCTVGEFSPK